MTPAALDSVVTNARAKIAAGDADYLDVAVVALADQLDDAVQAQEVLFDDLNAAVALLRRYLDSAPSVVSYVDRDASAFLANHPVPAK